MGISSENRTKHLFSITYIRVNIFFIQIKLSQNILKYAEFIRAYYSSRGAHFIQPFIQEVPDLITMY